MKWTLASPTISRKRWGGVALFLVSCAMGYWMGNSELDADFLSSLKTALISVATFTLGCVGILLYSRPLLSVRVITFMKVICQLVIAIGMVVTLSQALSAPRDHSEVRTHEYQQQNFRRAAYDFQRAYVDLCVITQHDSCAALDDLGRAISSGYEGPNNILIEQACPPPFDPLKPPLDLNPHLRDGCTFARAMVSRWKRPEPPEDIKADYLQMLLLYIVATFFSLGLSITLLEATHQIPATQYPDAQH